ncbi:MAG TPA: dihydrofolate reductase [Chitinophagaceae bacterium]|nr:dihydrofolate reductase [Chitinophagaceae bacterium]
MIISAILAASQNNVIGKDNRLPWKLPADLRYFKNLTWGMPVIMGRKTYESVNCSLPGRSNIVISRNPDWHKDGVLVTPTLQQAIQTAGTLKVREIFISGGGEIFRQSFGLLNKIYITRIQAIIEGDAYFPEIPVSSWSLVREDPFPADEKNPYPYNFQIWEKRFI